MFDNSYEALSYMEHGYQLTNGIANYWYNSKDDDITCNDGMIKKMSIDEFLSLVDNDNLDFTNN